MNKFHLKLYPDAILREKAFPINHVSSAEHDLIEGMSQIMYMYKGIGLAAPQVGIQKRIIIADIGEGLITFINPEIVDQNNYENNEEGCLSLPEIQVNISRSLNISVQGIDSDGNDMKVECSGLLARVIQHEIDHLNGVLIIDHASTAERYILKKKLNEQKYISINNLKF